ncbi:hypothetical protein K438DRAFT_131117 [Mycena galopus ATCC 62051]|nr:hypothetical protein K438DRAFT_131117 [Mycena galopus ATCC 62051]
MSSAYLGVPGFLVLLGLWACTRLVLYALRGPQTATTRLCGPPSPSRLFGLSREILDSPEVAFSMRTGLHATDPCSKPSSTSIAPSAPCTSRPKTTGFSLVESSGVGSYGQKEICTNGKEGSDPGVQQRCDPEADGVFFDSAYKLKSFWDATLESTSDGAIIEVEEWMNRVALDSIGIAGFSHDFRYLDGQQSPVTAAFEAME